MGLPGRAGRGSPWAATAVTTQPATVRRGRGRLRSAGAGAGAGGGGRECGGALGRHGRGVAAGQGSGAASRGVGRPGQRGRGGDTDGSGTAAAVTSQSAASARRRQVARGRRVGQQPAGAVGEGQLSLLPQCLDERDRPVLAFAREHHLQGTVADSVQVQLGLSDTRYYQLLVGLLERTEVQAAEPELVGQLRALRECRQRLHRR